MNPPRGSEAVEFALKAKIARLEAEIRRLRDALLDYGCHGPACMAGYLDNKKPRGECDCGFSATIEKGE